jgi:glycosyltransferase involved in cell wall biosynthesis
MKILYISYFYPPLGGPAVFRNLKVVKYLSEAGAIIDVICPAEPEYLYHDSALESEFRQRKLIRTPSLDLMSIFTKVGSKARLDTKKLYLGTSEKLKRIIRSAMFIDDKIGWVPSLIKAGQEALKAEDYDLIYVSCGPFSASLGAYYLSKHSGVPYVIDYRDYWSLLDDYQIYLTPLHKLLARKWEKKILANAKLVITATKGIGMGLTQSFGTQIKDKLFTLYNGWDEADFDSLEASPKDIPEYEIAYFGAIYARRNLKNLFRAVRELKEMQVLPERTIIRLYGNYFVETYQEIEASAIKDMVEVVPQLNHRQALQKMKSASLLLLLINSDSPFGTLTSKVFEYLRLQKPILALIPAHKEAAELLKRGLAFGA